MDMVAKGVVQPEKMPPTDKAAFFHGLRVHHQITIWKLLNNAELSLDPIDWGWYQKENILCPVMTDREVAPACGLKVIRCNCKEGTKQCGTNRCTCRKNGLGCVSTCGDCHCEECENREVFYDYILTSISCDEGLGLAVRF